MIPIKSADRTRKEMQDLEAMAAKLLNTARKLPSGQDRHNALQEIGRFRARITALQRLSGMAQSPQPYDLVTRPARFTRVAFAGTSERTGNLFGLPWYRSPPSRKPTRTVAMSSKK